MKGWTWQRAVTLIALMLNTAFLVVGLFTGPRLRDLLVLLVIECGLLVLLLKNWTPELSDFAREPYSAGSRIYSVAAGIALLFLSLLFFFLSSRKQGVEAVVPALIGLPWLWLAYVALWRTGVIRK